jgi:hypothetical protein
MYSFDYEGQNTPIILASIDELPTLKVMQEKGFATEVKNTKPEISTSIPHEISDRNASFITNQGDHNSSTNENLNDQNESLAFPDENSGRRAGIATPSSESNAFTIRVRVSDELNASAEKAFVIRLLNVIEDFDSDGIENAYDFDDTNFTMPQVGSLKVSLTQSGRVSLSAPFSTERNSTLPLFSFIISKDEAFSEIIRGVPALTEGNFIHASLFDLKPSQLYFARIEATHRAQRKSGFPVRFITPADFSHWWDRLSESQTAGWRKSSWFGNFLPHKSGWIYHAEMNWLYAYPGQNGDLWLWSEDLGWLWTQDKVYPHLYANTISHWYYFLKKQSGVALFYDYSTEKVISGGK